MQDVEVHRGARDRRDTGKHSLFTALATAFPSCLVSVVQNIRKVVISRGPSRVLLCVRCTSL